MFILKPIHERHLHQAYPPANLRQQMSEHPTSWSQHPTDSCKTY